MHMQGFHIYNTNQWNLYDMDEEWHEEIERRKDAWVSRVSELDKEGKQEEDDER